MIHKSFSMSGGNNANECYSFSDADVTGTSLGNCAAYHTVNKPWVTAVAHLDETAGSWYASPPPSG